LSAKKFTILVIPEGSHRVRRFGIRRGPLQAGLAVALVLVLTVSLLLVDYFRTSLDRRELHHLKSQNRSHQKEMRRLASSLDDLRQELVVLAQNDAKVRVLTQLAKPRNDTLLGVGGPAEEDAATEFAALQRQIDQMRQSIDLRRESQEEIQGFLNDQRSLLAAKPKGLPTKGWTTSVFGMRKSPFSGKPKMHEGWILRLAPELRSRPRLTASSARPRPSLATASWWSSITVTAIKPITRTTPKFSLRSASGSSATTRLPPSATPAVPPVRTCTTKCA
jgi:hypothetical protein